MKKVLIIISDNNKGKFISKGFSDAFKKLSFFVYEKKIYDLNLDEVNKIEPDIIFTFWTDIRNKESLKDFLLKCKNGPAFMHCAENKSDIPEELKKAEKHYIYTSDSKTKKNKYVQPVSASDYRTNFETYKFNITFSGNPACHIREVILTELIKNFGKINIFSRSYDFYKSLDEIREKKLLDDDFIELYRKSYKGYVETQKELSDIYVSSKINIDLPDESSKDINYRLLEILASGGFIIAPFNEKIVKQFDDGKDIETYKDNFELTDKIDFYLKNLNLAKAVALNGKRNAVSNFSYYDKLKTMLKVIYGKDFGC